MPKIIQASDVPKLLHPGMNIFIEGYASEPQSVIHAIKENPEASNGVNYVVTVFPGLNRTDYASLNENATMTCFHMTKDFKSSFSKGKINFIPIHYYEIYMYLETSVELDFAVIQVSMPDQWGYCSLGVTAEFLPVILQKAKTIVAEVNPNMPRTAGEAPIHQSLFDYVVEVDYPLPEMPSNKITLEMEEIAKNVSSLIQDGDTIQLGVGSVPDAILYGLSNKKNLGIHTGMISDAIIDLVESGVVNGQRKSIDKGKIVTAIAVGTKRLYDFINNNPLVDIRPINYTHSLGVLKHIDNFISINSAIEVDLFGQVNAETVKGVQFGGIGGQGNFVRGSRLSRGGKSIIALLSTVDKGNISRIVPTLKEGSIVTTPRTDVQYIVTEYGIANLKNKSLQERSEELISISAPQFREELREAWNSIRNGW